MTFSNFIDKFNETNLTFFLTRKHIHLDPLFCFRKKSTLLVCGMNILTWIPSLARDICTKAVTNKYSVLLISLGL